MENLETPLLETEQEEEMRRRSEPNESEIIKVAEESAIMTADESERHEQESLRHRQNHPQHEVIADTTTTMPTPTEEQDLAIPAIIMASGDNDDDHDEPWYANPMQVTAMLSNFSTSYNVVNISLVLPILELMSDQNSNNAAAAEADIVEAAAAATEEDKAAVASSLLAGMVLGQLIGGALGDSVWLGRLGALRLVMMLQIVASLGSSFCDNEDVYVELASWRFVLGIGAGGVYPLAAVLSAEQGGGSGSSGRSGNESSRQDNSLHRMVLTFSMQGVGFLAVPLVSVLLLFTVSNLDVIWRVIVGLGCLPGVVLMILQWRIYRSQHEGGGGGRRIVLPTTDSDEAENNHHLTTTNGGSNINEHDQADEANHDDEVRHSPCPSTEHDQQHHEETTLETNGGDGIFREDGVVGSGDEIVQPIGGGRRRRRYGGWWDSIRHEEDLARKLLGTACTWFLFDVLFYGNTLFEPIVVEAAFGSRVGDEDGSEDPLHLLQQTALDSLLLTTIALPGYAVAGLALGSKTCGCSQTPRFVMLQGFAVMSFLYLVVGVSWNELRRFPIVLVLLYSLTFFFANYGPNTTTFVLPSLIYSPECRSTLNGISAASGKFGALVGATLFAPAADSFGDATVMLICSGIAVLAFIMTQLFVRIREVE